MAEFGDGGDATPREDDSDPEVTAITRRLDRTGDTLSAIQQLEALLVERTGQISVVTPEQLASAHLGADPRTDDPESDGPPPPPPELDWSLPIVPELDPAPGFSPWIDPTSTAAAQDDTPPRAHTDVTTQLYAVFAAPEPAASPEATPEQEPEQEPEPKQEPEPDVTAPTEVEPPPEATAQSVTLMQPGITSQTAVPARPDVAPHPAIAPQSGPPTPGNSAVDVPLPLPAAAVADETEADDEVVDDGELADIPAPLPPLPAPLSAASAPVLREAAPEPRKRRPRLWPFGRR